METRGLLACDSAAAAAVAAAAVAVVDFVSGMHINKIHKLTWRSASSSTTAADVAFALLRRLLLSL